jgi:hypothetical protein
MRNCTSSEGQRSFIDCSNRQSPVDLHTSIIWRSCPVLRVCLLAWMRLAGENHRMNLFCAEIRTRILTNSNHEGKYIHCNVLWSSAFACFTLVSCLACSSTLMMVATYSPETSVDFQRATRRYRTLHNHRCENLKSYILWWCLSYLMTEGNWNIRNVCPREYSRTWQRSLSFSRSVTVALFEQWEPLKEERVKKHNIQLDGVDDCPCTLRFGNRSASE